MPYKWEKKGSVTLKELKADRRCKLTDKARNELISFKGKLSQRKTAKLFGVSKRLVIFIWFPERAEHAKKLYKERRKDGRYYIKEVNTKAVRSWRRHKNKLIKGVEYGIIK